jgi:hypothetical protein
VARAACHPRRSAIPRFVITDLATEAMTPTQTTTHDLLASNKRLEAQHIKTLVPSRNRRVQPAVTTADCESPGTTRAGRGSLPRDNETDSLRQAARPAAYAPSDDEYEQRPIRDASGDRCSFSKGRLQWRRAHARSGRRLSHKPCVRPGR